MIERGVSQISRRDQSWKVKNNELKVVGFIKDQLNEEEKFIRYKVSKFTQRIEIIFKQLHNDNSPKIEIKAIEWGTEF